VKRSGGTATTRTLLAGVCAAVLAAALAGCSAAGGTAGTGAGTTAAGGSPSPSAAPGRYQVLPEPCGSVEQNTLKALLPVSDDYTGQATLTYDTDRSVGCDWSGKTKGSGATRDLSIDIERAVSYDPAVGDEDQAQQEYDEKAAAAGLPSAAASLSASALPSASTPPTTPSPTGESPSSSASASTAPKGPQVLSGLGDSAYLDDVLTTKDSGVQRDVTIVFRKSNVLVTVVFSEWSTDDVAPPGSQELRDGARKVADQVAGQFN